MYFILIFDDVRYFLQVYFVYKIGATLSDDHYWY